MSSNLRIFRDAMIDSETNLDGASSPVPSPSSPVSSSKKKKVTASPFSASVVFSERAINVLTAIFNQLLPFSGLFIEEQSKRMAFLIALRRPLMNNSKNTQSASNNNGAMNGTHNHVVIISRDQLFDRRLCGMIWSYITPLNHLDKRALTIWGYQRWSAAIPSITTAHHRIINDMRNLSASSYLYQLPLQHFIDYYRFRYESARSSEQLNELMNDFRVFGYRASLEIANDKHIAKVIKQLTNAADIYDAMKWR
jgi:hypothetical protein